MDTSKLCFGCFNEHDGVGPCPHCGYDLATAKHPFIALPIGTILNGRYLTGRVLGVGGFGVTYLAFDMTLEIAVAIKEFLPSGIALRDADHYTMTVSSPEEQPKFDTGASKFLEEARLLAKLRDVPNIVTVQDYFRENSTAYFVMEYIEGVDLMKYTQQRGGKLSYEEALRLILPIIDSLAHVHAHNLLHRDISPDNIVVMKNGTTRLLDFGAARLAVDTEKSKSIILKHGFAPEEQYRKHGNQGPWSDEYALAATMYLIITGVMPPDAIERVHEDTLASPISLGVEMPQYANDALMKAMAVSASGRFPDMASFSEALTGKKAIGPASSYAQIPTSMPVSGDELPTASSQIPQGNMVQGKTVAMAQDYVPQKVLSPSILAGEPVATATVSQEEGVTVPPAKVKKSIWKRPLTYILAGLIVLIGVSIPVGIYITQNYEWGTPTTTRKPNKPTTKKTSATTTEQSYEDPKITDEDGLKTYSDSVRCFSISAASNYAFENKGGVYTLVRDDGKCALYADLIREFNDMRVSSLNDFLAQSDDIITGYTVEVLGLTGFQYQTDECCVIDDLPSGSMGIEFDAIAERDGQSVDLTIIATERKEKDGVFLTYAVIPRDSYGAYSDTDLQEVKSIFLSLKEDSEKETDYVHYAEENMPEFLYRKSDIASVDQGKIGNDLTCLELKMNNVDDPDSRLFVILLDDQPSITQACTAAEQALGSSYKFGGYTSVNPIVRKSETEMRIRNYKISKIEDDSKQMDCTTCVINLNGRYFAIVATCSDEKYLEQMTLDFTMVVRSINQ